MALIMSIPLLALAWSLAAPSGSAEPAPAVKPPLRAEPARLVRVEPAVADVNPLSASNAALPVDLRVPLDFDHVYRIERPGHAGGPLARQSGGITAVFPQSSYVETPSGLMADVPPGTVYVIGGLPATGSDPGALIGLPRSARTRGVDGSVRESFLPALAAGRAANRVDGGAPSERPGIAALVPDALGARPANDRSAPAPAAISVWSSELYRRVRLAALLTGDRPASTERAPTAPDVSQDHPQGRTPADPANPGHTTPR